jgi:hypothetical protein
VTWKGILRKINKAASVAKDVEAVTSFNPNKIVRRAKNKAKGKVLGKLGFWRW